MKTFWRRPEAIASAVVAMLAVATVAAMVRHGLVFQDYSARFGELSRAEFESLNAEMRWLSRVARASLLALAPADLALLVLSMRAWNRGGLFPKLAFFAGLVVAAAIAFALLLAAMPHGAGMIG